MPDEKMTLPLNAMPFDEMIASMGTGIAEAQRKLDEISFEITKMMSGTEAKYRIRLSDSADARTYSLLELGFAPTFYQFVDTVLEVKVAFSMSSETSNSGSDRESTKPRARPWMRPTQIGTSIRSRARASCAPSSSPYRRPVCSRDGCANSSSLKSAGSVDGR